MKCQVIEGDSDGLLKGGPISPLVSLKALEVIDGELTCRVCWTGTELHTMSVL